jgi:jumonji domain-containing protein 2
MLYAGCWRALFAWHTEDADLHSVNYLHAGAPKAWYCVAPAHRARFESLACSYFAELSRACPAFLRHKDIIISPTLLRQSGIPFTTAVQRAGEFVVVLAGAYHAGFNHGFNLAEAVNFATPSWLSDPEMAIAARLRLLTQAPYALRFRRYPSAARRAAAFAQPTACASTCGCSAAAT